MNMRDDRELNDLTIDALQVEVARTRKDKGPLKLERGMAILGEEFGEACEAVLKYTDVKSSPSGRMGWREVGVGEFIQVASVALQLAELLIKEKPKEGANADTEEANYGGAGRPVR